MKRLSFVVLAIVAVVVIVRVAKESARAREWLVDPRWKEAVENYNKARERHAPQVEIEQRKREIGQIVKQLRAEQAQR